MKGMKEKDTTKHQLSMLKVRRQTVRRLKGREKKQNRKTYNKIGTARVRKSSSEKKSFTWPFINKGSAKVFQDGCYAEE